jgi:cobalt/nickel transport system permease protein
MVGLSLFFTGESFLVAAHAVVAAHLPVMIVEGLITLALVSFLRKVKPEVLNAALSG